MASTVTVKVRIRATPALMGFGDEDRLIALTDGDNLMNVTLMWRMRPHIGEQLPGAPHEELQACASNWVLLI